MGMKSSLGGHKFLMVGPLPPPATGQSVSFEMLCGALELRGASCKVVNLRKRCMSSRLYQNVNRCADIAKSLIHYVLALVSGYRNVYITVSQSLPGFCRDFVLIWLARLFKARVVVHLKGGNYDGFYSAQSRSVQCIIRRTLRCTDRILVLGEGLRNMYLFDPVLLDRVYVVPNGLPTAVSGTSKTIQGGNQRIHVLYLSNLIESKGYFQVLEAIKILRDFHKINVLCTFAGLFLESKDDVNPMSAVAREKEFQDYVKANHLEDQVKYMGAVAGNVKCELLENAHFFILPTKYMYEGQPVSIIEAMAYGCVVITTKFRAIPDLVIDRETGMFVNYGDPKQIAAVIADISTNLETYAEMSRSATKRYLNCFTMEKHLETIIPHLVQRRIAVKAH